MTIAFYRHSIDLMLRTGAKHAPTPGEITRQMTPRWASDLASIEARSVRAPLRIVASFAATIARWLSLRWHNRDLFYIENCGRIGASACRGR